MSVQIIIFKIMGKSGHDTRRFAVDPTRVVDLDEVRSGFDDLVGSGRIAFTEQDEQIKVLPRDPDQWPAEITFLAPVVGG
jgi:hypothetical protein